VLTAQSSGQPLGAAYVNPQGTPVAVATVGAQSLDLDGDTVADGGPAVPVADVLLINCVAGGGPFPPAVGDVNCDGTVDVIDAELILQYDVGTIDAVPCPDQADVNGDGAVNAEDALLILQFVTGIIDTLPPAAAGVSAAGASALHLTHWPGWR
jgi:hypothetical protein